MDSDFRSGTENDVVHFSGVTSIADDPRLVLRFESIDESFSPWIGTFNPGYHADFAVTDVIPFGPDAAECLVVSAGQGFVVTPEDRRKWLALQRPFPITFAEYIEGCQFVLIADMASLSAFASDRVIWSALDLADGELVVDGVDRDSVRGRGWHAPDQDFRRFRIDLATGAVAGE